MRSIKAGLLATAALAAVLAPAGAASAKTLTVEDGVGDAWEDVYNYDTQEQEYYEAGEKPNVDVLQTVIKHTARKIVITSTYSDLVNQDTRFATINRLRFVDGPNIGAAVDTFGKWKGTSLLFKDRSGAPIKCANLSHEIDYDANTVQLNIPRTCVGTPNWVEVNSYTIGSQESAEPEGEPRQFMDNALRSEPNDGGWTEKVRKD